MGGTGFQWSACINCRSEDRHKILVIFFLREGSPTPDNSANPIATYGTLYVPDELFSRYIDLLRSEKPVKARVDGNRFCHYIYTGDEPVGEDET